MTNYESIRLKISKYLRKSLANIRRKKLTSQDFTIISNNCWAGMIYESYNLIKSTPTVGLFFMPEDYIKFLNNLEGYIYGTLSFVQPSESTWFKRLKEEGYTNIGKYPIGQLSDGRETIEIFFLHYQSEQEAKNKWERRCKRINWDKLLIKFNDQNGCTEKDLLNFCNIPFKNKIFFTCKTWDNMPQINQIKFIKINQPFNKEYILTSYEPFGSSITKIINEL